ncbi:MAG: hypothetical protein ACRD20_06290 [Terriglobales bacterium]
MDSTETSNGAGKRSTRIRAQIPLRVTSLDPEAPFSESGHTLVLNPQGCGVRLSRALEAGLAVSLDELPTRMRVTARIANCVPLGAGGQWWMVGIALDEPGNVWGVHPAPADWGSDAALATAAGASPAASPAKRGEWPFQQFSSRGEFHPGKR